ncbi:MAG: ATP-binding protein [Cyanobacteria bacterium P01_G01_bin.38]
MISKPFSAAVEQEQRLLTDEAFEKKLYTVLVIDDSDVDRFTYRRHIGAMDLAQVTFLEADCGESGLALCQQQLPDLILLDYLLPDINGLEFFKTLKERMHPVPPIIMLTGEGNEKVAVEAMKIGVRDYLVKGELTKGSLIQAIRRVLSQQALQELMSRREQQQQLVAAISSRISQADNIADILETAAEGSRQLLDCDRTIIYRFESDMSGTIVAESVLSDWTTSLSARLVDTCFKAEGVERYLQGHISVINEVADADLSPCYLEMLERFEVKANLVVPIVISESETADSPAFKRVWGLLIAHQCRGPRDWRKDELELLDSLSVQLAIALRQAELILRLKERNQDLDEFTSITSHDIRAPLRAIRNLANWIEEDLSGQLPTENIEQLKLLRSRAQRLDNFVAGLLEYSRVGRTRRAAAWVSPQSLVDEVIESLEIPPGFEMVVDVASVPALHTHKLFLQQTLSNLIGNAIKYHDRTNGRITITAEDQGQLVRFAVADDGPGIKPEYHKKIFEVFQTLANRDNIESTGIGLSIVKKVVERQGGQVSVRSSPGRGSTFIFTWPKQ